MIVCLTNLFYHLIISCRKFPGLEVCLTWRTKSYWTGCALADVAEAHCASRSHLISVKTITHCVQPQQQTEYLYAAKKTINTQDPRSSVTEVSRGHGWVPRCDGGCCATTTNTSQVSL